MINIFTNKKNLRDLRLIVMLMVLFLLMFCCGGGGWVQAQEPDILGEQASRFSSIFGCGRLFTRLPQPIYYC